MSQYDSKKRCLNNKGKRQLGFGAKPKDENIDEFHDENQRESSGNYVISATALSDSLKKAHACPDHCIDITEITDEKQGHFTAV